MTTSNTQGLLASVQDHFTSQGWSLDDLDSFKMEMNDPSNAGGENGTGEGGNSGGQGSEGQQPEYDNPFLQEVSEEHRAIVAPYLKKWDGNVTQRFQQLQSQFQPYAELGNLEDLQNAYGIYQRMVANPKAFVEELSELLKAETDQGPGSNGTGNDFLESLPEEFKNQFNTQQQALEAIAEYILNQEQQVQQQREDAELDAELKSLHDKHGDFDEEFVLVKMSTGLNGEQAVQAWKAKVQEFINNNGGRPKPKIKTLAGGGSAPGSDTTEIKDLSSNDTKTLVANLLAAANQE